MESKYKIGDTKTAGEYILEVVSFDKNGYALWRFVGVEETPKEILKGAILKKGPSDGQTDEDQYELKAPW